VPPPPPPDLRPIAMWVWVIASVLVLGLGLSAFSATRLLVRKANLVDDAVDRLHARMSKDENAAILADADPLYLTNVGERGSNDLFEYIHTRLGSPRSSARVTPAFAIIALPADQIVVAYATVFERGSGLETITLHETKGAYRIANYTIDSAQLRQDEK
jgi:hypothetical protein